MYETPRSGQWAVGSGEGSWGKAQPTSLPGVSMALGVRDFRTELHISPGGSLGFLQFLCKDSDFSPLELLPQGPLHSCSPFSPESGQGHQRFRPAGWDLDLGVWCARSSVPLVAPRNSAQHRLGLQLFSPWSLLFHPFSFRTFSFCLALCLHLLGLPLCWAWERKGFCLLSLYFGLELGVHVPHLLH